jgi:hypothetical protein
MDADSHVQQVAAESQSRTEAALDKQLSQIGNAARLSTDGRTPILSRYTELNADQKMLVSSSISTCRRSHRRASPHQESPLASRPTRWSGDLQPAALDLLLFFRQLRKLG